MLSGEFLLFFGLLRVAGNRHMVLKKRTGFQSGFGLPLTLN